MTQVTIVDYECGNIFSVSRGLERCGAEITLAQDPNDVRRAERLILPGVGAFGSAVERLTTLGLADAVLEYASTGRPFLGICVGMQLLFDEGEEFGMHRGLGLIPGRVEAIDPELESGERRKVPHIGWSHLQAGAGFDTTDAFGPVISGEAAMYFVHSFVARPIDPSHCIAEVDYLDTPITAWIRREHIVGTQFHPEKSGPAGLQVLDTFVNRL